MRKLFHRRGTWRVRARRLGKCPPARKMAVVPVMWHVTVGKTVNVAEITIIYARLFITNAWVRLCDGLRPRKSRAGADTTNLSLNCVTVAIKKIIRTIMHVRVFCGCGNFNLNCDLWCCYVVVSFSEREWSILIVDYWWCYN